MLTAVCLGTNDIRAATEYYDAVLGTLDMRCIVDDPHARGYGGADGVVTVWIVQPYNEQPATSGNGTQIMFQAPHPAAVDAFHAAGIAQGGRDEGAPGPRPHYHPDYYGAYLRDPDGNKLHVAIKVGFPY